MKQRTPRCVIVSNLIHEREFLCTSFSSALILAPSCPFSQQPSYKDKITVEMNLEELAETKENFTLNNIKYKDYIHMRFISFICINIETKKTNRKVYEEREVA